MKQSEILPCQESQASVAGAVLATWLSLLVIVGLVLKCRLQQAGIMDKRQWFHSLRIVPWGLFNVLSAALLVLEAAVITKENLNMNELTQGCVSLPHIVVMALFVSLLLCDLFVLGFVLRVLGGKLFLLFHHIVYIVQVWLMWLKHLEYIYLVLGIIAIEESQECIASASYLSKGRPSGPWWRLFTVVLRLMVSSFSIGADALFMLTGSMSMSYRMCMVIQMGLWGIFLYQEWCYLCQLVLSTDIIAQEELSKDLSRGSSKFTSFSSTDTLRRNVPSDVWPTPTSQRNIINTRTPGSTTASPGTPKLEQIKENSCEEEGACAESDGKASTDVSI